MAAQQRVELFSGRVKKVKPTNVSEQRYDFLKLSEAEPDLGVPATTDSADVKRVLLTDKNGKRYWSDTLQIDDNGDFQSTGEIQAEAFATERLEITDTGITARFFGEDINLDTDGNLQSTGLVKFNSAMGVSIGLPDQPGLTSRAVAMNTATPVSRGMAQMNFILGKLVPKPPPNFPKLKNGSSQTLVIQNLSTYRMCAFTQTDSTPGQNKSVAGGTVVDNVRRTNSYTTNYIENCGPGDRGSITIWKNGTASGNKAFTDTLQEDEDETDPTYLLGVDNGLYGDLRIADDQDYAKIAVPAISPLFWQTFDARGEGTVTQGWNEVYIRHNNLFPETNPATTGTTNTAVWYYDASTPGDPVFSNVSFTPAVTPTLTYSSTIPHYANTTTFTLAFDIAKLSGDMYPTSNTFITSSAGGAFDAPVTLTYASAGISTPLPRNYLASTTLSLSTTVNIKNGVGRSTDPVTLTALNSYGSTAQNFTPTGGVLFKTGTSNSNTIEETNIVAAATFGSGSSSAYRIVNPGSTDTPSFSASAAAFNSQSSTLQTYDAVVVGEGNQAVLKHDNTNYSTGFLPPGPDLSGQAADQYFTFAFARGAVSKFNINITGTIRGLWVAVPAGIGTDNGLNGWLRMDQPYAGSGIPGTGTGGNGSNGCSIGGVVTLGSNVAQSRTCTFGTLSTSNTATSEVYIRIKLQTGDVVTALSLSGATN
jgi:hypothetical protein